MTCRSILVLGGSGFVGRHLVALLATQGRSVTVPTRRLYRSRHLLVLPGVRMVQADVHDDRSLATLLQGMDAVINLVGVLHSRPPRRGAAYGPDFQRAHIDLPKRLAAACAAAGVKRLIHMSAVGSDSNGPSMYMRSKGDGDAAVLSQPGINATVVRPSIVFGPEDRFLNLFARLQRWLPLMLVGCAEARFQPVYVNDVAQAMAVLLDERDSAGRIVELVGPKMYTLRQIVALSGEYSGHPRPIFGLPPALARIQAMVLEHMPGGPLMSRDNLDSMKCDNVGSAQAATDMAELGITPAALETIAPYYLAGR
jgi:uncharacterized protein YbjT (DUF2867 family)